MTVVELPNFLAPGHVVGEFEIDDRLDAGRTHMRYLATERTRRRQAELTELYPEDLVARDDRGQVVPYNLGATIRDMMTGRETELDALSERFHRLTTNLELEVDALADPAMRHPNLLEIESWFAANGTRYVVSPHHPGQALHYILVRDGSITEPEVDEVLYPILDALEHLHGRSLLHPRITWHDIFIREDGTPLLRGLMHWSHPSKNADHKRDFAAKEELAKKGKRGPWTNVYNLSAVLFRAITGELPSDVRIRDRKARMAHVRPAMRAAIDRGLAAKPAARPQSVAEFRSLLGPPAD